LQLAFWRSAGRGVSILTDLQAQGVVGGTLYSVLLGTRSPSLGKPSTRELARLAGSKLSPLSCLSAIG
jgi:hypothetical protein